MHQLLTEFLRGSEPNFVEAGLLGRVRQVQKNRLIEVSKEVVANPADTKQAKTLMLFPVLPVVWEAANTKISAADGEWIGASLLRIGRFEQAQPWFERAVAEAEQGDVHGRVDHASLGSSLHQVGDCLSSLGRFERLEVILIRGKSSAVQGLANALIAMKGVKHGRLTATAA